MKTLVIAIFIGCLGFIQPKQPKNTEIDKIVWDKNRPLTWADFKGKVDSSSKNNAYTTSSVYQTYKTKGDSLILIVKSFFYINESWKKEKQPSVFLLKHEQIHFDIVELFARRLRKAHTMVVYNKSNIKTQIKIMYDSNRADENIYQDLYDKETDHSKIKAKQLEWEKKVAKELKELETYSNTSIKILLKK